MIWKCTAMLKRLSLDMGKLGIHYIFIVLDVYTTIKRNTYLMLQVQFGRKDSSDVSPVGKPKYHRIVVVDEN